MQIVLPSKAISNKVIHAELWRRVRAGSVVEPLLLDACSAPGASKIPLGLDLGVLAVD